MFSEDSVLEADHFKPISLDSDSLFDFYAPCEETEDGAILMSYKDVPTSRILVPELKFDHIKQALSYQKSTVKDSDVNEIRNFSDNPESLQATMKLSRYLESFQSIWKVSRQL